MGGRGGERPGAGESVNPESGSRAGARAGVGRRTLDDSDDEGVHLGGIEGG